MFHSLRILTHHLKTCAQRTEVLYGLVCANVQKPPAALETMELKLCSSLGMLTSTCLRGKNLLQASPQILSSQMSLYLHPQLYTHTLINFFSVHNYCGYLQEYIWELKIRVDIVEIFVCMILFE